jgi:hypothetical protein
MAAETHYFANTGVVQISSANSNLDGSGTVSGAIFVANTPGTLLRSVIIKATGTTTQGMVRLYVVGGGNTFLIAEVEIPAMTPSATDPAFETYLELNYAMKSGYELIASTQNAETFNVIAEACDWSYYATSVRPESTNYTANTGMVQISTANSNLDGTGSISDVIVGASQGTMVKSITIKSIVSNTHGMVRLFLYDGTNTRLMTEIFVPPTTKSGTAHSFSYMVTFSGNGLYIRPFYKIRASTQNGEAFNIIAEGLDVTYPA